MPSPSSNRLEAFLGLMPFSASLGIDLETAEPANVVGTLAWSADRCTSDGNLHGGAIIALADTVGGFCAFLNLPDGTTTATIESETNFFRGVRPGLVRATARPLHTGKAHVVVQTDVLNMSKIDQSLSSSRPRPCCTGSEPGTRPDPVPVPAHLRGACSIAPIVARVCPSAPNERRTTHSPPSSM